MQHISSITTLHSSGQVIVHYLFDKMYLVHKYKYLCKVLSRFCFRKGSNILQVLATICSVYFKPALKCRFVTWVMQHTPIVPAIQEARL